MQSLGRGRGFKVVDEYTGLDDEELMSKIGSRIEEIRQFIGVEDDFSQLEDEVEELTDEVQHFQARDAKNARLLVEINLVLSESGIDVCNSLSEAVHQLITEYEDLVEEIDG